MKLATLTRRARRDEWDRVTFNRGGRTFEWDRPQSHPWASLTEWITHNCKARTQLSAYRRSELIATFIFEPDTDGDTLSAKSTETDSSIVRELIESIKGHHQVSTDLAALEARVTALEEEEPSDYDDDEDPLAELGQMLGLGGGTRESIGGGLAPLLAQMLGKDAPTPTAGQRKPKRRKVNKRALARLLKKALSDDGGR